MYERLITTALVERRTGLWHTTDEGTAMDLGVQRSSLAVLVTHCLVLGRPTPDSTCSARWASVRR